MHLQVSPAPFLNHEWSYEAKMDGYRLLAFVQPGRIRLVTRGGVDYARYFPQICAALAENPVDTFVVDAEVVAFEDGKPSFAALQRRVNRRAAAFRTDPAGCTLFCFDILHVNGFSTRDLQYADRRRILSEVIRENERIQIIHADDDGPAMYEAALALGMEGVVAKRKTSIYQPRVRSPDWRKIKPTQTGKLVVLGYVTSGSGIGSLLVGQRGEDGKVAYSGRVSSGLSEPISSQLLTMLRPARTSPSYGKRIKHAVWVDPEVVVEVRYFELTEKTRLRHAVFSRIRTDLVPASVPHEFTGTKEAATSSTVFSDIAQQILDGAGEVHIDIVGTTIDLKDLDRVVWPTIGRRKSVTKRTLLHYLISVAPFLLRHLRDRPLAFVVATGDRSEIKYDRTLSTPLPDYIETRARAPVKVEIKHPHILCNNLESLLWLANAGVVEFHAQHARRPTNASTGDNPDYLAFDLDPFI